MRRKELLHIMAEGEDVTVEMVDECIREEVENAEAVQDAERAYKDGLMRGMLLMLLMAGVMGTVGGLLFCLI